MLFQTIDDYIPKFFERDTKLLSFISTVDSILDELKLETISLNDLIDPMKIPSGLLDNLGYYLSAGLVSTDSETIKRQKIATAIQGHKRRGSFNLDAKPKIDAIAAGDSVIIRSFDKDDWILVGDGLTPTAYYRAALGADGIDEDLGISLIGEGLEIEVAGNIYIDVDNMALTAGEQEQIRVAMLDIVPAYMKVHFGYLDGFGSFIEYFLMD